MSADGDHAPDGAPIHPGLLTTDADGSARLIGGHCAACEQLHLPAGPACPYCGAGGVSTRPLSRAGVVWGATTVIAAPPGYLGPVPFGFGVVELPEGVRVITRLTGPDVVAPGTPVTLTTEALPIDPDGRTATTWTFAPDPAATGASPAGPDPTGSDLTGTDAARGASADAPHGPTEPAPPGTGVGAVAHVRVAPGQSAAGPNASAGASPDAGGAPPSGTGSGGVTRWRSPGGLHPSGASATRRSPTWGGCGARRWPRPASRIVTASRPFCGTAYAGVAAGHKVLSAPRSPGPDRRRRGGLRERAAALMLAASDPPASTTPCSCSASRRCPRHHPLHLLRAVAGAGRLAATPRHCAAGAAVLRESGLTADDLARVVVKNRRNGVRNPDAMFRKEVTAEEVLASKAICDPLTLFMLCSPNEGAAAVVLRRANGPAPASSRRVTLASAVLRSHLPGNVLGEATPLSGLADDRAIPSPSTLAADAAYAEAGIGPDDVDIAECQDTDAARELLAYEELRFCAAGDAGRLLHDAVTEPTGPRPVNVSGGLLAKGEPLGASALGQVVELVRQLRGEAGGRQVPDRRRPGPTVGRGANAPVTILTR
jgi:uncharacterized OB-fold protein